MVRLFGGLDEVGDAQGDDGSAIQCSTLMLQ